MLPATTRRPDKEDLSMASITPSRRDLLKGTAAIATVASVGAVTGRHPGCIAAGVMKTQLYGQYERAVYDALSPA
jgi:hypothetical protein